MKAGRQIIEGETIRPLDLVTTKKKSNFFLKNLMCKNANLTLSKLL
jgi:hypothetical protein